MEKLILFCARLLIRMSLVIGAWQIRNSGKQLKCFRLAELGLGAISLLADALGAVVQICWGLRAEADLSGGGRLDAPVRPALPGSWS